VGGGFAGSSSSLNLMNRSVDIMLAMAYHLSSYQITGLPDWAGRAMYNLQAKSDSAADEKLAALTKEQAELEQQHMLQALLADRFNLKTHWETREGPVYDLVVAKGGPKLHAGGSVPPSADELRRFGDANIPEMYPRNGTRGQEWVGHECPIAPLAGTLGALMGSKVIDKTGLTGTYDFDLQYSRARDKEREGDPTIWPSIPDAVEDQLGLKLEPAKGLVTVLVIDHIERPSEN